MELEKYLVLHPDGRMEWIQVDRRYILDAFCKAIGCEWLEQVTLPYGFCCVVDEVGKIRQDPKPVNPWASMFYPGTWHGDPLVGPVVFVRIGLVDGEYDWVPLIDRDLALINLATGLDIPDPDWIPT